MEDKLNHSKETKQMKENCACRKQMRDSEIEKISIFTRTHLRFFINDLRLRPCTGGVQLAPQICFRPLLQKVRQLENNPSIPNPGSPIYGSFHLKSRGNFGMHKSSPCSSNSFPDPTEKQTENLGLTGIYSKLSFFLN